MRKEINLNKEKYKSEKEIEYWSNQWNLSS